MEYNASLERVIRLAKVTCEYIDFAIELEKRPINRITGAIRRFLSPKKHPIGNVRALVVTKQLVADRVREFAKYFDVVDLQSDAEQMSILEARLISKIWFVLVKIIAHIKRRTKLCLEERGLTCVISFPVLDNEVIDTLSAKSILDDADVLIKEIYLRIVDFYNEEYRLKAAVTLNDLPK